MALDGVFLRHIMQEIKAIAVGGRISQIYQPTKDEIVIALRTGQGNKKLLLSSRANSPRVQFTEFAPENPEVPPMLCMLLRKRLGSGKLIDVRQPELERILFLDFESTNELGDKVTYTIAVEIMGKYSNIILIDTQGIIVDSLKRVDMTVSSQRLVLPNLQYQLPPPQEKYSLLTQSPQDITAAVLYSDEETVISKALLNRIQGVSPIVCREVQFAADLPDGITNHGLSDTEKHRLQNQIALLAELANTCGGKPVMAVNTDGKPMDIAFMDIKQYGAGAEIKVFDSFSLLLDTFYSQRDNIERMKAKSQDLHKLLSNLTERLSKKINLQMADLKKCADREQLRIKGDLLQANLYRVTKSVPYIEVENFYDEHNSILRIPLNPAISPAANAQKYYKNYAKAKTAEKMLTQQIEKAKQELEYIGAVQDMLTRASTVKELSQIRFELMEQGYIKKPKGKQKPPSALPPLRYSTGDGFQVLVGRNNKQNDLLTLKQANKNDIWFHTKDIHGSHTILVTEGKEPSEQAIQQAAQLAAYHSKARESSGVPVDYTKVRYVSKPHGAKPGMVIYVNNKTIFVTPEKGQENPE